MPDTIQSRFDEGLLCLQNREYDEAIQKFREVFDLDPETTGIHHYLGRSLLGKKLHAEAIEEFSCAIKKNPLDGNSRYWLALVLMEQDRFCEAVPILYEAIRREPGMLYHFSEQILSIFQKKRSFSETREFFRQCTEIFAGLEPSARNDDAFTLSRAHPYSILGQIFFEKGLLNEAVENYREALRIYPKNPSFHWKLADIYFISNFADEAISEYRAALRLDPEDAEVHKKLADAFVIKGLLVDAFHEYREAVKLEPDNADFAKAYSRFRTILTDDEKQGKTIRSPGIAHDGLPENNGSPGSEEFHRLVTEGENELVEYKTSTLWSKSFTKADISASESREVHKFGRETSKFIVAKTLAGFLNTEGGNLIIGIKENKKGMRNEIAGIEAEYSKLKDPTTDGYRRMIVDEVIRKYLPPEIFHNMNEFIRIQFPKIQDTTLCWLEIKKSGEGVFVRVQDEEYFFIRVDAETRQIADKALVDYYKRHFR
ncbi:MAG: tetratricopeptide repeat protein [Methanoregula sp.]|jgi:tetratricopeptide (TPR) repeat protein|uniref:tetratricopeptide repeat protein n=1 Tax=Methanoregula sp. TaxID=2052170 RepID=UPI003D11A81B